MRIERHIDGGRMYHEQRRSFMDHLLGLPVSELARSVPATPAWSVHDVVAHLVGICADLNAGRFGPDSGDEWTAHQVRARRDHTLSALCAEWDREAPRFEDGLRLFGYDLGSHYVGDLLQHVADVRGVLPSDEALVVALDFYLSSFDDTLNEAGIGAVVVQLPDVDWVLGSGPPVATVAASSFEIFRSLGGRRNDAQLRSLGWTGDLDVVVPLMSRYPLPVDPIDDAG